MNKKMAAVLAGIIIVLAAIWAFYPKAAAQVGAADVATLYYSPTCPHCHKARAFLDKIEKKYPSIRIERVNVATRSGSESYFASRKALKVSQDGVPFMVFGTGDYILGYGDDSTSGAEYEVYLSKMAAAKQ